MDNSECNSHFHLKINGSELPIGCIMTAARMAKWKSWLRGDMAWCTVSCPDGLFDMDVDGVARLINSYAYAKALDQTSILGYEYHVIGPDIETVNTDWEYVAKLSDQIADEKASDFYLHMSTGWRGQQGIDYLEGLFDDRDDFTDSIHDKQKRASKDTMANINVSIDRSQTLEAVCTFIRDAAADTESALVTAALVAGVSLALPEIAIGLGVGAVGKGLIQWQNRKSVGLGFAEGSIELVMNVFTVFVTKGVPVKPARLIIGLVFGAVKGVLKTAPNAYMSPEDVAQGKSKSVSELLNSGAANIPMGIASPVVAAISSNPGWVIPATVLLRLGLRSAYEEVGKPSDRRTSGSSGTAATRQLFPPNPPNLSATGRVALNCIISDNFIDCARPSEDFVLNYALRPISRRRLV